MGNYPVPEEKVLASKPKSAGIQGRISFSEGNNGARQEIETNTQPQTKQTQWSRGARLSLDEQGVCRGSAQAPGRAVMRETHFRPHPLRNGPAG